MRNGAEEEEEMITMSRRQQQRQQRFARRPHDTLRLRERKNKRHDPLLCKCLVAMGMYHLVDRFDNFNRFIRMSSAQCQLYGPEFVVKYAKLHARIEALCSFSVLDDFGPRDLLDGEPEEEEEEEEEKKSRRRRSSSSSRKKRSSSSRKRRRRRRRSSSFLYGPVALG
ncbi:hypothetical protein D5F01_LYC24009 [Larimichthys crocea]|uniref:Uncharacterized protein n=1 Tax=Larimichthys crocea TaxID=215358 RepID=A0A6G0HFD1_LARCR|nr:hypothetical protein D5F01_LYC24009 [Larimichthys crocea]